MSAKLSPKQALAMYYLLFTQEQPKQSDMQPKLKPRERKELVEAGLIALSKKGRASYVSLTDRAWGWAEDNLGCQLSKSQSAAKTLQCVLSVLGKYREDHDLRLLELMTASRGAVIGSDQIRAAYMKVADGQHNRPVKISDLADALGGVAAEVLVEELLKLKATKEVFFSRGDDPQGVSEHDRGYSAWIDDTQMHLVAFTR